ncbi:phosphoribosylanthranilate isomerase [Halobacterium noricense]|uniref:phosphoribosylanthranilate isomerase n=1 Tax=Halobacterium noricense TaxID=223182 RepID=UPI001E63DC8B|nr:phosphoribosylanthranilate isomerase [Halobacterium noricense]UHH24626.1 phosphoribosylanthranilate isomerase [Halobacterium noricense]
MTRAKICGLTNDGDRRAAVDAGADALGFIVDVPVDTPREVSVERAADLVAATPPFVTTVLVTMPESPERAVELVERVNPDAVQLHGDGPVSDVAYVAANTPAAAVLKTVDAADPEGARYDDVADALLVDSVDEAGAGGTGRTHDWDATREFADSVDSPVVLAGGLTPENVAEAAATVEPFAVDVASGVERTGGEKDHDAVRRFVANATEHREVEA